jgi:hypothetical protein
MIGVATRRRPRGRPGGHPRDRTVRQDRRAAAASAAAGAMAAARGHPAQAQRRRAGHPGGHAGPAGLHLRGPLAPPRQAPPAPPVPLPAPAVGLQQAPAWRRRAAAPRRPGGRQRHRAVERRRVDRRLHAGGVRPLPGDRQALGAGRVGPVRLLRQPLALVLGGCGCTWSARCTACRSASRWPAPRPTSARCCWTCWRSSRNC